MRRSVLVLAASLLLAACACQHVKPCCGPTSLDQDKRHPLITVVNDEYLAVGPDPIHFLKGESGLIVWNLPRDLDVSFPDDTKAAAGHRGIEFIDGPVREGYSRVPEGEFTCKFVSSHEYQCINRNSREPDTIYKYEYRITVLNSRGKEIRLDPSVWNGGH
jgi:hypothetical protein